MKTILKSLSLLLILATAASAQLPSALPTLTGAVFDLTVDQIMVRDATEPTMKLMTGTELRIGLGLAPTSSPTFNVVTATSFSGAGTGLTGTASGLTAGNSTLSGGQALGTTASPTFAGATINGTTSVSGSFDATLVRSGYYVQANTVVGFGVGGTFTAAFSQKTATPGWIKAGNGTANDASATLEAANIVISPPASATPASNGHLTFEATSNTSLTVKYKGSDGTVRSVVLTLAP